jgi:hypothetical protein
MNLDFDARVTCFRAEVAGFAGRVFAALTGHGGAWHGGASHGGASHDGASQRDASDHRPPACG